MKSQNHKSAISGTAIIFALIVTAIALATCTAIAFGQTEAAAMTVNPPGASEWIAFLTAVAGYSGLGTMGLVALAVQGGMLFIRQFQPKYKLLAVTGGTLTLGVLTLVGQGLTWPMALMHSSTLAAGQVFVYEVIKQVRPPKITLGEKKTFVA